jgi:hypothetical protein
VRDFMVFQNCSCDAHIFDSRHLFEPDILSRVLSCQVYRPASVIRRKAALLSL